VSGQSLETGYTIDETEEYNVEVVALPNVKVSIYREHYAASWWDASGSYGCNLSYSGIAGAEPTWYISTELLTADYLDPNNLPDQNYKDSNLASGVPVTFHYSESGEYTWNTATPFAVSYLAFGVTVHLDTTVSIYASCRVSYEIYNTSGSSHKFRMYTCGGVLDPDTGGGGGTGGMELHVWDMGVT
jgi:hypothetical protein